MTGLLALSLSAVVVLGPPPPAVPPSAGSEGAGPGRALESIRARPWLFAAPASPRRARRLLIASGVLMSLSVLGEMTGAIISTRCSIDGEGCTLDPSYSGGSKRTNTRYTLSATGPGSAYILSRLVAIPVAWTGKGLLLAGIHTRTRVDAAAGAVTPPPRWLAWTLEGTGLGLWAASRLALLGFTFADVCQDPRCVYAFDLTTLGISRGLSFSGSALSQRRRTLRRVQLNVTPMASLGVMVNGRF